MPTWLVSALAMLSRGAGTLVGGGRSLILDGGGAGQFARVAGAAVVGSALADPQGGLLPGFRINAAGEIVKVRRRRRRALTASDKADIGFIAGILGKPAGRDFAMIVASRPR